MMLSTSPGPPCFVEEDQYAPVLRRAFAEAIGTLLLVLLAASAGAMAARSPALDPELALFVSAAATAAGLVALISAFGSASGGHFNPLITGLQWLSGERSPACTLAYVTAQLCGAASGAMLAGLLFGPEILVAGRVTATWQMVLSEGVASAGLMIIVFSISRSGLAHAGPFAVGAWLFGGIVALPSASYANPAVSMAALLAPSPIALTRATAALYVLAEVGGALLAYVVVGVIYPREQLGPGRRGELP